MLYEVITNLSENALIENLTAGGELVTERLDHWAKVSGDRTFFYYGEDDVTLSYAEFAARTDAIAGNLVRLGIEKGDRVSVRITSYNVCYTKLLRILRTSLAFSSSV